MLLLARGESGMSSPVDGMAGAIPLIATGAPAVMKGGVVPVDRGTGTLAEMKVDLRWVRAKLLRESSVVRSGVHPGVGRVRSRALLPSDSEEGWGPVDALGTDASAQVSYSAVVGLLGGASNAAR